MDFFFVEGLWKLLGMMSIDEFARGLFFDGVSGSKCLMDQSKTSRGISNIFEGGHLFENRTCFLEHECSLNF